jgi:hypothetical protein
MGSSPRRNSTPRARKARSVKPSPPTRRKPAQSEELMAILEELVRAIALIKTAISGLRHNYTMTDEIVTLETAVAMLRRVDSSINDVAEGRPSKIRPQEIEDEDDDEEGRRHD